ncbi:MAG: alkaline phosphatase [Bacteroides sp.]|nr:alkaline phosphatase [Bacteroides sp.]
MPLQAQWKAKHVIFIGLDGWGSYSVEKASTPIIKYMMENGGYTLEKRTVLPSSSAVNWATMFMGAGPELHGYTTWGSKEPDLPPRITNHYGMFPSIWGLLRDKHPEAEIGYFCQWDGLMYLAEKAAINIMECVPGSTDPDGWKDRAVVSRSISYIKEAKPNFVGIFLDEPDHVGHESGHDTEGYYEKMAQLDGYISSIVEAVKEAGMYEDAIFVLTSDHGGIEKGHGGMTLEEMNTPFVVFGKGVQKGFKLEDSMMQYDVAATLAYIFDLEQPQVWTGRAMKGFFLNKYKINDQEGCYLPSG